MLPCHTVGQADWLTTRLHSIIRLKRCPLLTKTEVLSTEPHTHTLLRCTLSTATCRTLKGRQTIPQCFCLECSNRWWRWRCLSAKDGTLRCNPLDIRYSPTDLAVTCETADSDHRLHWVWFVTHICLIVSMMCTDSALQMQFGAVKQAFQFATTSCQHITQQCQAKRTLVKVMPLLRHFLHVTVGHVSSQSPSLSPSVCLPAACIHYNSLGELFPLTYPLASECHWTQKGISALFDVSQKRIETRNVANKLSVFIACVNLLNQVNRLAIIVIKWYENKTNVKVYKRKIRPNENQKQK